MSRHLRTVEVSDPRYEHAGLRHATVHSRALGRRADCTLWAPAGASGPLPLVVLLHGVYGSHWGWAMQGGAHVTAADSIAGGALAPFALAMPSDGLYGLGSGYLPGDAGDVAGGDVEAWILDEVPELAAEVLGGVDASAPIGLAGLSMGGFGALTLAVPHADRVPAAAAMSSITAFDQMELFVGALDRYEVAPERRSVIELVRRHRDHLPAIHLDCGTDDLLIEHVRTLHRRLLDEGVEHEWVEHPGRHEWAYWRRHVGAALAFVVPRLS